MPEEVEKQARKELKRLERMPEGAGEYSMMRTYLDWLIELPWAAEPEAPIDIAEARRILDDDHYGLDKVKRRILEYLAVRKLNPAGKSPILCFVGPPGVGKTSLGQSIARATGRKFVRVSLGGVHDEAEIRGHRRTYVGALPGNIIQSLRKAGTRNCVLMLDEVDKLGAGGFHGDPASALLEVLDPEQNSTFRDNYLGGAVRPVERDVHLHGERARHDPGAAARPHGGHPAAGLHRAGEAADRAPLPGRRASSTATGLDGGAVRDQRRRADGDHRRLHARGGRAQSRARDRQRVPQRRGARSPKAACSRSTIGADDLAAILGPRKFEAEVAMRSGVPGVATGLAWTPVGGDILFVEAARMPGTGKLILTGQLGDVMKESAQAALSLVKARSAAARHRRRSCSRSRDIHIHVPAGATPKDGPSAGVAMFVALASLLTGRPVRSDVAMTGEISLRGLVLPIGGVKEKVLAALRAGITTVMLPARNRRDLEDIPADARDQLPIVWVETVDDADGRCAGAGTDADRRRLNRCPVCALQHDSFRRT